MQNMVNPTVYMENPIGFLLLGNETTRSTVGEYCVVCNVCIVYMHLRVHTSEKAAKNTAGFGESASFVSV